MIPSKIIEHQVNVLNRIAQSKVTYENSVNRLYLCFKNTSLKRNVTTSILHEIEKDIALSKS